MKKSLLLFVLLAALSFPGVAHAEDEGLLEDLAARFTPEQPAVSIKFNVAYRFLFLRIKRLANAKVTTAEGRWLDPATGKEVPVIYVDALIDTPDDPDAKKRGRVSIHRRFITIMALPELETLYCVKQANEFINPLFKRKKESRYTEIYDFESGGLKYCRKDYLTGTVATNLSGTFSMAQQGQELAVMLKLAAPAYRGEREMLKYDSDFTISVNIDGVGTPFVAESKKEKTPVAILGKKLTALRIDMKPSDKAEGRGHPLTLWTAPLIVAAEHAGDRKLVKAAALKPSWSMVPLVADYGLAIGYVRVHLTGLGLEEGKED